MTALLYGWFFVALFFICWRFIANGLSWLYPRYRAWNQLRKDLRDKLRSANTSGRYAHGQEFLVPLKESKEQIHARQIARVREEEEAARKMQEEAASLPRDNRNYRPPGYFPPPVSAETFDKFLESLRSNNEPSPEIRTVQGDGRMRRADHRGS